MSVKQPTLFETGFLETFAGKIIENHKVAVIELVANAWDAGATNVFIKWPENDDEEFSVEDNGHGMTEHEFDKRFRVLNYNREKHQGGTVEIPFSNKAKIGKRTAFGKNGKGRLAGFAFGDPFLVITWKNGKENTFKVSKDFSNNNLLNFQKIGESIDRVGNGTKILVKNPIIPSLKAHEARMEIGMRFLTDPNFNVNLNGEDITFNDIPPDSIFEKTINIPDVGEVLMKVIDVHQTDKTTLQHGIAWHVNNRLVGECTWKGSGSEYLIDGRRMAAKRYIFIIKADCLSEVVLADWTMFNTHHPKWEKVAEAVHAEVKAYLLELTKEHREEVFSEVEYSNRHEIKKMGLVSREKWEEFIKTAQEDCSSISTDDLVKLGALLAKLENTKSKYNLIHILANAQDDELQDLTDILEKWDIDFAKIVLDEIEYRTKLLEKLQSKVLSNRTDEVHDLQPLFHRGLWIFGPEYETIEYTSNKGMTKVIQDLFGASDLTGSRQRPDFAILIDGTVGMYGLPSYDEFGGEIGIEKLAIVELKKPGVPLGQDEVNQCWKYVKELLEKGLLQKYSKVMCFVLGSELVPYESERTTKMDGNVIIQPLSYDTVIKRAQSRLLNLHQKVKDAPFLINERLQEYLREKTEELFD